MSETTVAEGTLRTACAVGDVTMSGRQLVLNELRVGDTKPVTFTFTYATGTDKGTARAPQSGTTMMVYDPDRATAGEADSGSTTTLVCPELTGADDFWNGCPITITGGSPAVSYETRITDWVLGTTTLTFGAIPVAVAAGYTFSIGGYPLLVEAAATLATNTASVTVSPADVTGRPGDRIVVCKAVFTGSVTEHFVGKVTVKAANYVT